MANVLYQLPRPGSAAKVQYIVGDTAAGLPASVEGSIAYAKDTDTFYTYSGAAWVAVGAGGSSHNILSTTHSDSFATDTPSNGDVLTWVAANSRWEASPVGAATASIAVENDDVSIDTAATVLDFDGPDFRITAASHEAEIMLSYKRQTALLGGIIEWFDANDPYSVERFTDGARLAHWFSNADNGQGYVSIFGNSGPLYKTNIVNGQAIARFDGTSTTPLRGADHEELSGGVGTVVAGMTIFAVAKPTSTTAVSYCLVGKAENPYEWQFNSTISTTNDQGPYFASYQSAGASNAVVRHTAAPSTSAFNLFEGRLIAGNQIKAWLNGGAGTASTTFSGSVSDTSSKLFIGERGDSSHHYFSGDIAEIIIFRRPLAHAEMDIVANYLAAKYNLSVSAHS